MKRLEAYSEAFDIEYSRQGTLVYSSVPISYTNFYIPVCNVGCSLTQFGQKGREK